MRVRSAGWVGLSLLALVLAVQILLGDDENVRWRALWWDTVHAMSPRDRGDAADSPVVIVAIDAATMHTNGPWPWSRDKLAAVVSRIAELGASVISFDILLTTPDPQSPVNMAEDYRRAGWTGAAEELERLGDTDAFFATVLRDGLRDENGQMLVRAIPSVLPVVGVPGYTDAVRGQGCNFPSPSVQVGMYTGESGLSLTRSFSAADPPLPMFTLRRPRMQEVALSANQFNGSFDFVVRRVPAVQQICGKHLLLTGAEALRVASGQYYSVVRPTRLGHMVHLGPPEDPLSLSFPIERNGDFWLHFGGLGTPEAVARRYLSANDLFDPEFDPARIAGKIAMLAVIDLGRVNERKSPLGETIYGAEVHAQMIEQIAAQDFLRRPWVLYYVETVVLGVLGLAVVLLIPLAPPMRSVAVFGLGLLGLVGLSVVLFRAGVLIDLASPVLGLAIVGAGVGSATLIERDRARLFSEISLSSERVDRAFLQGEMDAAARIQQDLLPPSNLSDPNRFDLVFHLDTARTVGGDFFDYQLEDDRYLFLLVADVAGKGADASQFAVLSQALIRSAVFRTPGASLGEIVTSVNTEITAQNASMMFVTAWFGRLDLELMELDFTSAGHDAAVVKTAHGKACFHEKWGGPPLGLMAEMEYPVGRISVAPGTRIILHTDGIAEALNANGDLFGLERLLEAVDSDPEPGISKATVDHVVDHVRRFAGDCEQSDDLTIGCLTILGSARANS